MTDELFKQLTEMGHTQRVLRGKPAILGDGQGNLHVVNPDGSRANGMVWARVAGLGICSVRCRKVATQYALPVIVDYGIDRILEVIEENGVEATDFSGNRGMSVGPHSHDLLGPNPDIVQGLRFMPLLVTPTNPPSLSVYVWPYHYTYGGAHKYWPGGSYDLTALVPAASSQQKIVIMCLNPATNTQTHVAGSDITPLLPGGSGIPFTGADIAAIDATAYEREAAVRLYAGQTTIERGDLIADLRNYISHDMSSIMFNDANIGALVLQTGGTLPGIVEFLDNTGAATGIETRGFAVGEQGSSAIEIPHDYKEGSDLVFHVHWGANDAPTGTDYVKWQLTYSITRYGTTFPASTTIYAETPYDTQYEHTRSDFAAISGSMKIGDQFNFKIKRILADGAAFAGEALVETLGLHYQCDTLGSRAISEK
jgi:hypothetical protein